jgi:alkylhydroperoxidase family enzyme
MTPVAHQLAPAGGWVDATPRIRALDAARAAPWLRALSWTVQRWGPKGSIHAETPRLFVLLLQHGRLFWPWLHFAARLMPFGSLDRLDTELAILRVGWNCRCRYEWGQHVVLALAEGMPAQLIARVPRGPEASGWSPRQAALLRAADELHRDGRIAGTTLRQLEEHYDARQLIEIPMLVGHYHMLAGLINSVGLALEPELEEALARAPIHALVGAPRT